MPVCVSVVSYGTSVIYSALPLILCLSYYSHTPNNFILLFLTT